MKNRKTNLNIEPETKTISFFQLLKLKISNQNDSLSLLFTYGSMFLSILNTLLLNINYVNVGMQSRVLANQTGNFWIVFLLLLPFLFLNIISLGLCFLSRLRKTEFVGLLSFTFYIFNLSIYIFFWIFISAIF